MGNMRSVDGADTHRCLVPSVRRVNVGAPGQPSRGREKV